MNIYKLLTDTKPQYYLSSFDWALIREVLISNGHNDKSAEKWFNKYVEPMDWFWQDLYWYME